MRAKEFRGRSFVALLSSVFACWVWLVPHPVRAACNLIPQTVKTFNSTLGATNRPYAAPGESVEVRLRPCDVGSAGIAASVADSVVTVIFTPTNGAAARHAVVLTAAPDCAAIDPLLAACSSQLGAGGSATCVSAASSGLQVVDRADGRSLRFSFPDTDSLIGTPTDDLTLAGPVKLAVSAAGAALPCGLATQPCTAQSGLIACVDGYYANDGACGTGTALATFPGFTALPPPNDYQADCFDDSPPCTANATEVRSAVDADGNLLTPFAWSGILVRDAGIPVPRLLQSRLKSPLPFTLDDPIYIGSYTPEGGALPPIFEPQRDPNVNVANTVSLFGSADAPYTILRFARRQGTCTGGGRDTLACSNDTDCPGGSCAISGQNFDFSIAPNVPSGGALVVQRQSTAGFCQENAAQACSADCGGDGPCVNYGYEAHIPVPLEGLAASSTTRTFSIRESIDLVDRNGDGDTNDTVVVLRDRTSGEGQDLGAPLLCGLGTPAGRSIVRVSDPPFTFPAVAVENDVVAFLESELNQNRCFENGDEDFADAILRVVRLGAGETDYYSSPGSALRAVDAAPKINAQPLVVSNGLVFVRSSEAAMGKRLTERVNVGPGGLQADAGTYGQFLSADGRFVAFSSSATNLLGPGGDTNTCPFSGFTDPGTCPDVFVHDRQTDTTERVSVGPGAVEGDGAAFGGSPSSDAQFVAFYSRATNLLGPGGDTNSFYDVFLRDRQNGTNERISVGPGGLEADFDSGQAWVSADGRFVAFESQATNLLGPGGDTNGVQDVFIRDRQAGTTERINVGPGGVEANQISYVLSLSADGRFVLFQSPASNLLGPGGDTNGVMDVFVHDRQTGTTERVSVGPAGLESDLASGPASMSADGRFVVFESNATNLLGLGADTNGNTDIFVHDRQTGTTDRVSVGPGGAEADQASYGGTLSPDGRFVAFYGFASNLLGPGADTNGDYDVFVHDRQTGTTERVSVGPAGLEGGFGSFQPSISAGGRVVAFGSNATNLLGPGVDTNGSADAFVRATDPADPLAIDPILFANGQLADTVLEAVDSGSGAISTLCPAEEVSVANGAAAFLRPESTSGTANCPGGSLNTDLDTTDTVVQFWPGSGSVQNLGRAATAVSLSSSHVAALVSEADDNATDYNSDGVPDDTVVQIHPAGAGSWTNTGQQADVVTMAGQHAVFLTDEAAQGAGPLNGDGDPDDRVLQIYDASTSQLVSCSPVAGANCLTGVRQAATDFVVGEPTVTACGPRQLVAFRTSEAAQGVNLNAMANDVATGDADLNDDVLQVYDLVSGTLQNSGEAVTPCRIPECDPHTPYKVEGGRVRFLTTEADQGNRDLTGEGNLGLALQLYDFCNAATTTVGEVKPDNGDADPLATHEQSVAYVVQAGRCVLDQPTPCDPGDDLCGAGATCSADKCSNYSCAAFGGPCGTDADCARCIVHQPGSCTTNDDCQTGSACQSTFIVAATGINDRDDDGVPDDQDNCPDTPNTNQIDGDHDRVGDACDLQSCNNGIVEVPEACDDGNANDADGCARTCQPLTKSITTCQQAIGKAMHKYFATRSAALQACRTSLNLGKPLFFDTEETFPLTNPSECQNESATLAKLAKAAGAVRKAIAKKCTDASTGALSACSPFVDGLVDATASSGCLLATEIATVDTLLDGEYGRLLSGAETAENKCQKTIAAAGLSYAKVRLAALRVCRDAVLAGKTRFFDAAKTLPLTDPAQCQNEFKTATKLAKAGKALREAIADPNKCTDAVVASLASTCANTIEGLVNAAGTGGCLVTDGNAAAATLLGAIY